MPEPNINTLNTLIGPQLASIFALIVRTWGVDANHEQADALPPPRTFEQDAHTLCSDILRSPRAWIFHSVNVKREIEREHYQRLEHNQGVARARDKKKVPKLTA
jgi:hypothetical protein